MQQFTNKKLHPIVVPVVHKQCIELKDNTQNHGQINYIDTKAKFRHLKKLICKGTLLQVFIRDYRLEIQSVMLVFSTQLFELLPLYISLWFNSQHFPSPIPFPV